MIPVLPWLILLLPLAAAVGITLFGLQDRQRSARWSIGAVLLSLGLTALLIRIGGWQPAVRETGVAWIHLGGLQVDFAFRLDPLSLVMLLVVTAVGAAIHIYSYGYMSADRSLPRYFAGLSFFTFSMLGIVLSTNFVMLFCFWELVGLSSYLLIGFWFDRPAAADASKKAFLTNRLGDFGFVLGIVWLWSRLGSVHFTTLAEKLAQTPDALGGMATAAGLLIFCGAVGKSAQFPLHVWLPDAMEGPTPVSALIHAATMVAAGVYMLCRVFFLFDLPGSHALTVIAWIGGFTALLAAVIATQQNDIKRILAYSTLSQLGYMVMAVGVGGTASAMFHLTTHAFFKALLFLAAGSVIHALNAEQNIWNMGGLRRRLPITFWTFLAGTLALCGVPPLSGFFSKDEILAATLQSAHGSTALFVLGVGVAVLTTFYMFRLVLVAFFGSPRATSTTAPHESPAVMTLPLLALAVPSVLAGFWGFDRVLAPQLGEPPSGHAALVMAASGAAVLAGFALAVALYRGAAADPLPARLGSLAVAIRNRFYFDELYRATVIRLQDTLAGLAAWIDHWIVAGLLVRGAHGTTELAGRALRLVQSGNLQTYVFLVALGVALLLYLVLWIP